MKGSRNLRFVSKARLDRAKPGRSLQLLAIGHREISWDIEIQHDSIDMWERLICLTKPDVHDCSTKIQIIALRQGTHRQEHAACDTDTEQVAR